MRKLTLVAAAVSAIISTGVLANDSVQGNQVGDQSSSITVLSHSKKINAVQTTPQVSTYLTATRKSKMQQPTPVPQVTPQTIAQTANLRSEKMRIIFKRMQI